MNCIRRAQSTFFAHFSVENAQLPIFRPFFHRKSNFCTGSAEAIVITGKPCVLFGKHLIALLQHFHTHNTHSHPCPYCQRMRSLQTFLSFECWWVLRRRRNSWGETDNQEEARIFRHGKKHENWAKATPYFFVTFGSCC